MAKTLKETKCGKALAFVTAYRLYAWLLSVKEGIDCQTGKKLEVSVTGGQDRAKLQLVGAILLGLLGRFCLSSHPGFCYARLTRNKINIVYHPLFPKRSLGTFLKSFW